MPTNYNIQCYIESLSSDNKVTLRGCDGYRLLKDDKKYLVFFKDSSNETTCRLISESDEFTLQGASTQTQNTTPTNQTDSANQTSLAVQMLLAAQVNHKKVELEVNFSDDNNTKEITKVKLLQ